MMMCGKVLSWQRKVYSDYMYIVQQGVSGLGPATEKARLPTVNRFTGAPEDD